LLGLSAAFVFAAQMLNFPVAGGTSGHLVGGVLTAVLLGPSAGVIVISAVLIVQCLMFADGGISALGANIFNMALVGAVGGWAVYYGVSRAFKGLFGRVLAAAFAAWCSTVLASIACAGELAASHTVRWSVAFPTMAGVHMLIGIGEGLITALVLTAVAQARPELIVEPTGSASSRPYGAVAAYGLLIALGLAVFISPFASESPDGLDQTAEKLAFDSQATVVVPALMPEYKIERISRVKLGTSLAGAVGTLVVFGLSWLLARALVPKSGPKDVADIAPPQ
ncbi:MAG: PDGLE domain-containing protein, partial [Planctomycetes bacterium]|nr:PDGLE domain-containing protein [Planctomycetota bacterium]